MRQVNLYPVDIVDAVSLAVHPFWIRYAWGTLAVLSVAVALGYALTTQIDSYREQLARSKSQWTSLQSEVKTFYTLSDEQKSVDKAIAALRGETGNPEWRWIEPHPPLLETLYSIVRTMPDDLQLSEIQCELLDKKLILEGIAQSKPSLFAFVQNGLTGAPFLSSAEIEQMGEVGSGGAIQFTIQAVVNIPKSNQPNGVGL